MATKAFTVDLNKPLISQVGHLGEAYQEWIHKLIISKEGPRFFANPILEGQSCILATLVLKVPSLVGGRDLFITGESYAGHYIPQLAQLMIQFNKREKLFNLKGIAVNESNYGTEHIVPSIVRFGFVLLESMEEGSHKELCKCDGLMGFSRTRYSDAEMFI